MKTHPGRRLFLVAAALGVAAVFAIALLVARGGPPAVAGPDASPAGTPPNPGHAWTELQGHGVGASGVYVATNNEPFLIETNGMNSTPRMCVDTAGNVGIGTTAPGDYKLYVNGGDQGIYGVATAGTYQARPFGVVAGVHTTAPYSVYTAGGFATYIKTASDTPNIPYVYGELISVDDDGNRSVRGATVVLDHAESDDYGLELKVDDPAYALYSSGTATSYFGGNVGVGTTAPDNKLQVSGSVTVGAVGKVGCLKIRDTDDQGFTWCTTLNGTLTCSDAKRDGCDN